MQQIMKSTIILFVSFLYCAIVQAQILNKEVFNLLNLNYPGLEQVKRAYYEDKLETAANELLKYYRKRTHVVNPFLDLANVTITPIEQGWAVGAGMSDGIGFGANARTALITRGLAEMSRLGAALGADPATFMGMAGLGDLVLTCTDNQSRNRRFGMMLGQGMDVQSAQEKIGQVVEGYRNTKEVRELAHRFGVEMPITEEIYQVLYCGKNAREAALTLLGRARKDERSSH